MDDTERLVIQAEVDASAAKSDLADFAQDVAQVEDAPPPVVTPEVDATMARAGLSDVHEELQRLADTKPVVTPQVDAGPATTSLNRFTTQAEGVAKGAGSRFGASFVQDVGGALDQNTAAMVGQFAQGLESALAGAGIEESLAGPIGAAFAIGGVAFIAVQTFWKAFTGGADDAKAAVKGVTDAQTDLAKGDFAAASQKLLTTYKDTYSAAKTFGLGVYDVTRYLSGQTSATDAWVVSAQAQADKLAALDPASRAQAYQLQSLIDKLHAGRDAWDKSGDAIAGTKQDVDDLNRALGTVPGTTDAYVNIYVQDASLQQALADLKHLQATGTSFFGSANAPKASVSVQTTTSAQRTYARTNGPTNLWPQ